MQDLIKQLDFITEVDKLKAIYRQTFVKPDNNRRENSAEHSWQIALSAILLKEYATEEIDILIVVKMLLIHDIIEIDAGDLFAFAKQEQQEAQEKKEKKAANRIFSLLPSSQEEEFKSLWFEFEETKTANARFAKSIDRILPLIHNMNNEGGTWVEHKISKSQVFKRNEYLKDLAPKLWSYVEEQVELSLKNGWLLDK